MLDISVIPKDFLHLRLVSIAQPEAVNSSVAQDHGPGASLQELIDKLCTPRPRPHSSL